ncbi:MAG: aminotransferase class I/II-fold pyridoxal phosphate-dependent enzyme [Candidatus Thorarchaeota archaeon]
MTDTNNLSTLRKEIEQLTLEIVRLAGKRTKLTTDIGLEKQRLGLSLVNREVERNLRLKVLRQCAENGHDPNFALRLVNELIIESISKQELLEEPEEPLSAYHIFVKVKQLENEGKEIIHLEVGEPDFGPPKPVAESLTKAAVSGHAGYTQSSGIRELQEKIAAYVNQSFNSDIATEQIIVTVGGRFALFLGLATNLNPGDEVIIIDPSYPGYSDCVKEMGARPVHISAKLDDGWNIDPDLLNEAINRTTKMIIINSPGNPTGKIVEKTDLKMIADLSIDNGLLIVSDEVYSAFSFRPFTSVLQFPECNHIHVSSFSKTFGMTGFRLGYAISSAETIQRMIQLQNLSLTCVSEFVQHAGLKALDCLEESRDYVDLVMRRQTIITKELDKLPVRYHQPEGGFYVFPKISYDLTGVEFAERLLTEKDVAVVPGTAYGKDFTQFFRISVCQPENNLIESVRRMEEILS